MPFHASFKFGRPQGGHVDWSGAGPPPLRGLGGKLLGNALSRPEFGAPPPGRVLRGLGKWVTPPPEVLKRSSGHLGGNQKSLAGKGSGSLLTKPGNGAVWHRFCSNSGSWSLSVIHHAKVFQKSNTTTTGNGNTWQCAEIRRMRASGNTLCRPASGMAAS